jgi:hypothetical protein
MSQPECAEKPRDVIPQPAVEAQEEATEQAMQAMLQKFDAEERERLLRLRRLVARGERSDRYPVDKRQDFVRWLIDQGKLSDN